MIYVFIAIVIIIAIIEAIIESDNPFVKLEASAGCVALGALLIYWVAKADFCLVIAKIGFAAIVILVVVDLIRKLFDIVF